MIYKKIMYKVKILFDNLIEYCEINKCKIKTTRTDYENQTKMK